MGDVRTIKKIAVFFFFTVATGIFCYILFLHFLKLFRLVLRSCVIHRLIVKNSEGFRSFQHETYKYVSSSNFTTNLLKCIGSSIYPTKRLGLGCLCSNMPVFNMFFDTWDKPKLNIKTLNPVNRL